MASVTIGNLQNQEEILNRLASVNTKMGSQDATLKKIQTGVGVIKSIQRGMVTAGKGGKVVSFNAVNPDKAIFIIYASGNDVGYLRNHLYGQITATTLKLLGANNGDIYVNWQVIEFY